MTGSRLILVEGNTSQVFGSRFVPGIGQLVEENPGLDWVHPNIAVKDTGVIGLGLVALDFIPRGTTVILFGGKLMTWREITQLPEDMWDIPFQVSDDVFFGIAKRSEVGIGERINHSCDPNAGFVSEMRLVAIKDILPGDDVVMDYATCSSMNGYRLVCKCSSHKCRKVITGDDWRLPELRERLAGYFQPYLQQKIAAEKTSGLRKFVAAALRSFATLISP